MNGISADPELINKYGTIVTGLGADYISEVTAIYTSVDGLRSGWQGANATEFDTKVKGYEEDLKKLGTVIETIGTDLGTIAKIYNKTQEELAEEAGNL